MLRSLHPKRGPDRKYPRRLATNPAATSIKMVQILPPQRLVYFFFPLPQKGKSSASSGWGGVTVPYRNQGGVPPVDRHVGYRHPRPISRRVQISFRNAAQTFGQNEQKGTCFLGISCPKKCILFTRILAHKSLQTAFHNPRKCQPPESHSRAM